MIEETGSVKKPIHCVLVEAPDWNDCAFYAKWLCAAATAEAIWQTVYEDATFRCAIERLLVLHMPDLGLAAIQMLMELKEHHTNFVLCLDNDENAEFVLLSAIGFFEQTGRYYRMVLPVAPTESGIKAAFRKYAETEDEECVLHPENMAVTMSLEEAGGCQRRLNALIEFQHSHVRSLGNS